MFVIDWQYVKLHWQLWSNTNDRSTVHLFADAFFPPGCSIFVDIVSEGVALKHFRVVSGANC